MLPGFVFRNKTVDETINIKVIKIIPTRERNQSLGREVTLDYERRTMAWLLSIEFRSSGAKCCGSGWCGEEMNFNFRAYFNC